MATRTHQEILSEAETIWEQFKVEEITSPQFVAGIQALEVELPAGMSIRFS